MCEMWLFHSFLLLFIHSPLLHARPMPDVLASYMVQPVFFTIFINNTLTSVLSSIFVLAMYPFVSAASLYEPNDTLINCYICFST